MFVQAYVATVANYTVESNKRTLGPQNAMSGIFMKTKKSVNSKALVSQ